METSYDMLGKLLNNKYKVLHHLLFICVILLFWFLFGFNECTSFKGFSRLVFYSSTYVLIAYFNIYFLFKKYLLPGRMGWYLLFSLTTFLCSFILQHFIYFKTWEAFRSDMRPSVPLMADLLINIITYCMFIGLGLSIKMIKMWLNSEKKIITLEQENLRANLNSLKQQVSPHFLFNTFNNLYVLTKTQPRLAAEMILGFSDLMRYRLNECDKEKINIEVEIAYINNFLALEKLRKDNLDIKMNYDEPAVCGVSIEPLLLSTLIENAVKHGSQQMENPFIHIHMRMQNNLFIFEVINSKPLVSLLGKEESPGKGIYNLRQRLNLAYPLSHRLELITGQTEFTAKLQLELK